MILREKLNQTRMLNHCLPTFWFALSSPFGSDFGSVLTSTTTLDSRSIWLTQANISVNLFHPSLQLWLLHRRKLTAICSGCTACSTRSQHFIAQFGTTIWIGACSAVLSRITTFCANRLSTQQDFTTRQWSPTSSLGSGGLLAFLSTHLIRVQEKRSKTSKFSCSWASWPKPSAGLNGP